MQDTYENALFSRRAFVQLGSVALMAVGTSCTSQPSSQSAKTQPPSGATGVPPSPPAKTAKEINGTAPNTASRRNTCRRLAASLTSGVGPW